MGTSAKPSKKAKTDWRKLATIKLLAYKASFKPAKRTVRIQKDSKAGIGGFPTKVRMTKRGKTKIKQPYFQITFQSGN